ncbi:MAG: ATPase domain-containing protein [Candidatus Thorarchaeota archaeon]|nr:ATPase domain-containing protein [Candidatus Thorarchaeota archaeon]
MKDWTRFSLEDIPRGEPSYWKDLGAGKTLMCLHFVRGGICGNPEKPENAIIVCLDSSPQDFIEDAQSVFRKWDIKKTIERGHLILIDGYTGRLGFVPEGPYAIPKDDYKIDSIIDRILTAQEKNNAKRLVIDPVSRLFSDRSQIRRDSEIDKFTFFLQNGSIKEKREEKLPLTTILTAESAEGHFSEEHYGAHGVIRLSFERRENTKVRTLEIVKMRRTMHSMDYVEYEIGVDGIDVIA